MNKSIIVGLFAMALAGAVQAKQCPADMKQIDAALAKNPELTSEQMAQVKQYRAEGEKLHAAGKHEESEETLAKAKKILKIDM
jgi:hypothetical protein